MTDQNRTAETEQARDLVDTFQLEWDASYPGMHFKCVPSVTRLVRMGEYIARAVDETLAEFDLNRGEAEVLFCPRPQSAYRYHAQDHSDPHSGELRRTHTSSGSS